MKNEQQQQAKHLYFQSALNKSEIADLLGVNRRTVMLWVQQGNWDRLRLSAQHLPSMVVEKCYYMLNHYLDNLMSANGTISTFGPKEAAAINQLATAIKKINNRSAVNESMEMMSFFLDDVRKKDAAMADAIMPFAEQYIARRSKTSMSTFHPSNFNDQGFVTGNETDIMEQWLDEQEYEKMAREAQEAAGIVIPKEEEVLIKSFRDNCTETRVKRPVKDRFAPAPENSAPTPTLTLDNAPLAPENSALAPTLTLDSAPLAPENSAPTPTLTLDNAPLAQLNYEGTHVTASSPVVSLPNENKPDTDGEATDLVSLPNGPDQPQPPVTGGLSGYAAEQELGEQKKILERRKLIADLEKQLGEYLNRPGTQNSTAA